MRRRCSAGAGTLVIAASILFTSAIRADSATTPAALLEAGTKLARSCEEPKPGWPEKKLSGNFAACDGAVQAFIKAIELSMENAGTVKAASPPLTSANVNLVRTAYDLGVLHRKRGNRASAVRFFLAACKAATLPYGEPNSDQISVLMPTGTQAEVELGAYNKRCD